MAKLATSSIRVKYLIPPITHADPYFCIDVGRGNLASTHYFLAVGTSQLPPASLNITLPLQVRQSQTVD